MSDSSSLAIAQRGFDGWRRGDFDALETIVAPDVEWRWLEPGDWDCHSRADVMRTLRQRHAAGFAERRLNFQDARSEVVVVTAQPSKIGGRRHLRPGRRLRAAGARLPVPVWSRTDRANRIGLNGHRS